ncbi:MAG: tyrosine-type recombinase/integrase [Actinomycetota bacterium]|nr:tyrosine-type recombinase/integrase [Actinomycetota bacterium]
MVVADLREWLTVQGYSPATIPQVVSVALWLSAWMDDRGLRLEDLGGGLLDEFAAGFVPGAPGRSMAIGRIPVVRRFFLEPSSKSRRTPAAEVAGPAGAELDAWGAWQRDQAAISEGVRRNRRGWVSGFVAALADGDAVRWEEAGVAMVNAYIAGRGKGYAPASCSLLVSAMRSLLRWALATGRIDRDLSRGILRPRATRATLPRGLTPGQVDALLAAASPATRAGARDRAVVITLSRLGLRAGEAAGLTLDDIDWAAGRLTVIGKGQRRLALPLPADVGQALVAWLRVRPEDAQDRAVFVRLRAPVRKLTSAGISDIIVHLAGRAGLGVMRAHRLRHTAAMNVIAAGGTLAEARELLGHSRADSTRVYARTDLASLRALVIPFGQVP